MVKVIGVRFRTAGKIYYFAPNAEEIKKNDHVIVETARGIEYGYVVEEVHEVEDTQIVPPLMPIIRKATSEDDKTNVLNKEKAKKAFDVCMEKIAKHELAMKLVDSEYTFDNNKLLFYFTADGRIDFRELVKDLASVFRTRIELRQIGVRDETKVLGGLGICGRPLCCATFLSDFAPVSIKMAKEQGLPLNPAKMSGNCGRLMCCLKNEEEAYEYLNSKMPNMGDTVTTDDGFTGNVVELSVLKQMVKVDVKLENDEIDRREYAVDKLKFTPRKHRNFGGNDAEDDEIKKLEALEKKAEHRLDE